MNKKASIGNSEGFNYVVKINFLEDNSFYKLAFGRQLSDLRRITYFKEDKETKTTHILAKGVSTLKSVKSWIKAEKPSEFYARWRKDSSSYKDDSVEIFYRN